MINFYSEEIDFELQNQENHSAWINKTISSFNKSIQEISFIFCSDDYLLKINQQFLDHDYYTDIITFDNSEQENKIASDIFISIDRVKENASEGNFDFNEELKRVMIHGILHLLGFNDKTKEEQIEMRKQEDYFLGQFAG